MLSLEQKLQLVVQVWCGGWLVCALPRASRHTARGRLPGGGVDLDVQVVLLVVLHLALVLHPPLLEGKLDLGGAVLIP